MRVAAREILLAAALLALLLGAARAQGIVYTADRLGTRDLFLFAEGGEQPLLVSDDRAEYDPSPSPDGSLIAYAATSFINGVTDFDDAWSWEYRVVDLRGHERWRWGLPGADNTFRPAGGFELAWLPDGRSLLAQAYRDDGEWEVRRYFLDTGRTVSLGSGFGIVLDPSGTAFAIARSEDLFVVLIADGTELPLGRGRPLGWTADGSALLIERGAALLLLPLETPEAPLPLGASGPYLELRWSPDGEHYAYTTLADAGATLFLHDRDHRLLGSHPLPGFAGSLDWFDSERMVIELAQGESWQLLSVDLAGHTEVLVQSTGGGGLGLLTP